MKETGLEGEARTWASAEIERMRWLLQAAPDATAIVDSTGRVVIWNSQLEDLFRYSSAELVGTSIDRLVPERFRSEHPSHRSEYGRNPRPRPMGIGRDLYALRGDGSEFAAEISLSSLQTLDGLLVTVAIRDVTERRKLEDRFRSFVESAPDAVVIAKPDGQIVLVNAQTEELFGYPREELLGSKVEMLMPEQFREGHPRKRADYFNTPRVRSMGIGLELYGLRRDGTQFPIEISLSPLETNGEILVSSSIRDLTERRTADDTRTRLAAIVASSDDAIISLALDGRITSWNRAAVEIFGYTEDEALGRQVTMLVPPEQEGEVDEMLARISRGERVEHHDTVRRGSLGQNLDVSISMSAILDPHGRLVGASKVVRDISERRRTEAALAEAKEAAEASSQAFEAFSYSVAHDLRAPLRAIDGFSQALREEFSDVLNETALDYLNRVCGAAQQMAELIESLLSLAGVTHRELTSTRVDLSELAARAIDRLRHRWPERDVQVIIQPGLTVAGDATLLAVALENLLGNAWKFSRNQAPGRIEFGFDAAGYFVRDNGAGFDMAFSDKLFGVFQRLHSGKEFEGTGIGLATVQRIVRRHGGHIWAESEVTRGATFRFTLAERSS